jgi:TolA-binding protein
MRGRAILHEFVSEHPRSSRAGEASAKLGWLLYEAGQLDDATPAFESAAGDRVPQVKKSARDGLESIERRRARLKSEHFAK